MMELPEMGAIMERRYELRLEQMLAQAEVSPALMLGRFDRLETFLTLPDCRY